MTKGFLISDGVYAAVPCGKNGKQLMIIYNGQQLQVCKTEASARKFIDAHKKMNKSIAKLPVE